MDGPRSRPPAPRRSTRPASTPTRATPSTQPPTTPIRSSRSRALSRSWCRSSAWACGAAWTRAPCTSSTTAAGLSCRQAPSRDRWVVAGSRHDQRPPPPAARRSRRPATGRPPLKPSSPGPAIPRWSSRPAWTPTPCRACGHRSVRGHDRPPGPSRDDQLRRRPSHPAGGRPRRGTTCWSGSRRSARPRRLHRPGDQGQKASVSRRTATTSTSAAVTGTSCSALLPSSSRTAASTPSACTPLHCWRSARS